MDEGFDWELARESLAFYAAEGVPRGERRRNHKKPYLTCVFDPTWGQQCPLRLSNCKNLVASLPPHCHSPHQSEGSEKGHGSPSCEDEPLPPCPGSDRTALVRMPTTFKNAPLVELIAELRWNPPMGDSAGQQAAAGIAVHLDTSGQYETLYMQFGAIVATRGFNRFERVVPPGFPAIGYSPVYRYRKGTSEAGGALYQLGVGIFTANITPPYNSWEAFRPIVQEGVESLLDALERTPGMNKDFHGLSLRYIDAFKENLTGGRTANSFLPDVLQVRLSLPGALTRACTDMAGVKPTLQLQIPIQLGTMHLNLGDGKVAGEDAIIMDTIARSTRQLSSSNVKTIMAEFDAAHDVVHQVFFDLTAGLHKMMGPQNP